MKKSITVLLAVISASVLFAVSYKNNTYQKLANEYTKKAQNALDAGDYILAEDYAKKAEENAALSQAYIQKMLAKSEADSVMKNASKRLDYAKSINADKNFPMAYSAAQKAYASADDAYKTEDYTTAAAYAKQVLEALADIKEITLQETENGYRLAYAG